MPRRSSGRVTLQDIADRVGVTKITVSRALREPHRVSAALRLRIEEAIDELGYIPNHSAGALASGRSHSVALLIPSLSNSVFSEIQRGIEEGLRAGGYRVLIGHTGYSMLEEERLIDTYLSYGVDALILPGTRHIIDRETLAKLPAGASLVNPGRGTLIDEAALLEALGDGDDDRDAPARLRGAMLDAFPAEPLATDSPLWHHPRILITPHMAGPTPIGAAADQVAEALDAMSKGKAVETIDPAAGY